MNLMELINQKKAALSAGRRQKALKPTEGRSRWRILPGWDKGNPAFFHDFGQHFIKDNTGTIKAVYVCVDKTYGRPCQVCGAISTAIRASGDDAMIAMLKEAGASGRVLVNALHIDGEDPTKPEILELAPGTFNDFLSILQEWGSDVLNLTGGKDIIIERTGKGKQTKYSVQIAAKSADVDPGVMKKVVNLDEYVAQESEEQANRALANLSAVSGILAAPVAPRKPSMADLSVPGDDIDETLTIPGEPAAAKPAVAATPTPAPAATPIDSTGDPELDALLEGLGT